MQHKNPRSLLVFIAAGAVLVFLAAFFYQRHYFVESFKARQAGATLQIARSLEHQVLDPLREAAWGVADMPAVIETAQGRRPVDNAETLLILETTRKNFSASIVYVMNADGSVVACTPYGGGKTLTGNNYRFRPYYLEAISGRAVLYPALGVTTYERGIYVSAPVYGNGLDPQGVLVIKTPLEPIDDIIATFTGIAVLASPEGVIFASNHPQWLYHLSIPLEEREIEQIRQSKQFGDKPLDPLPGGISLLEDVVKMDAVEYSISRTPIGIAGAAGSSWHLTTLRSLKGAYSIPIVIGISVAAGAVAFLALLFMAERRIRLKLRKEVSEGRRYLSATLNSIAEAVIAFDAQNKIRHLNPAAEALTGIPSKEALGMDKEAFLLLTGAASKKEQVEGIGEGKSVSHADGVVASRIISRKGSEHDVLSSIAPIIDDQGNPGGSVMVLADVTSLRKAEEELRREREMLSVLLDGNPIPTFFIDRAHRVVIWNKACEAITGVPKADVKGRPVDSTIFYPPPPRPVLADLVLETDEKTITDLYGGKGIKPSSFIPEAFEASDHLTISGVERDVFFVAARCRDSQGRIIGAIETLQDITENKKNEEERISLERRLFEARKSESLGRMAAAIAHHFNNMLAAVIGNLELGSMSVTEDSNALDNIKEALKAAQRAADMSRLMLAYLGQAVGTREPLDLCKLCREVISNVKRTEPRGVSLEADIPDSEVNVMAQPEQIKTVISSLVSNSFEALEGKGGLVKVSVGIGHPSPEGSVFLFPVDWRPQEERYGCIEVVDNGIGMDRETLGKIFDPFFSTKFTGRGLGLPVVLGITKSFGGGIEVESKPNQGSRFRILLPLATHVPKAVDHQAPAAEGPPKKGRILVIEDEPMVRKMTERLLEKLGYTVSVAETGERGLEIYSALRDEILSVVCDLTMPGIDGWETIKRLRMLNPMLPIVLSSGYDQGRVMEGRHDEIPQAFLQKPFSMADLTDALSRALGKGAA
jgi:PAS domain S-box-containing protein